MDKLIRHKGRTWVDVHATNDKGLFYLSAFVFVDVDQDKAKAVAELVATVLDEAFPKESAS